MHHAGDGCTVLSFWKWKAWCCSSSGNSSIMYILYVSQCRFQDINSIIPNWTQQAYKIPNVIETILVLALIFCISFPSIKVMVHTQGQAPAAIQRGKGGTHNVTVCLSWLGVQRGVGEKTTSPLLVLVQIKPGNYCDGSLSGDVLATADIFTTQLAN